jgi:hypothetical protein
MVQRCILKKSNRNDLFPFGFFFATQILINLPFEKQTVRFDEISLYNSGSYIYNQLSNREGRER